MFSDNMKIGMLLISLGFLFLTLGVLLLFDGSLLTIGNILLLAGFPFILGFQSTLKFFNPVARPEKWKGIVCFFVGIFLVIFMRWAIVGMLLEIFGLIEMFARFLPNVISTLRMLPFIGPYVGKVVDAPRVQWVLQKIVGSSKAQRRAPV